MTPTVPNELNVAAWVEKANDDELNTRSLLTHRDGTPSGVCFLAQQMAEKYLKALLIASCKSYPKIHDLKRIATLLEPFVSDVFQIEEELNILNKYYVTTRYAGDVPEGFSWQDAEEAYGAAERVKEFVLGRLKAGFRS